MKKIKKYVSLAALSFLFSCTGHQADQAQVEIPLPSMQEFLAARNQVFGGLQAANSTANGPGQPKFDLAVVNVSGPGLEDISFVIPSPPDGSMPTVIRIPRQIPFGRARLFQVLFVFDGQGKELWYGDVNAEINSPNTALDLTIAPAHTQPLKITDLRGRFFIPSTGRAATGFATVGYTPPAGVDGALRRTMNLFEIPLVDGWGELFVFDSINITARLKNTGEILFANINSSSPYASPKRSIAEIVVPPGAKILRQYGMNPPYTEDFNDRPGQTTRYGYFGANPLDHTVCADAPDQPLSYTSGSQSVTLLDSTEVDTLQWNPRNLAPGSLDVTVRGGQTTTCSVTPSDSYRRRLAFDPRRFLMAGESGGFGYDSIFRIVDGPEINTVALTAFTDESRPLHVKYDMPTGQLSVGWQILYTELGQFLSGFDLFVMRDESLYKQARASGGGPGFSACDALSQMAQSQPQSFYGPKISFPMQPKQDGMTYSFQVPIASATPSTSSYAVLCPRSSVSGGSGSQYLSDFEISTSFWVDGGVVTPPPTGVLPYALAMTNPNPTGAPNYLTSPIASSPPTLNAFTLAFWIKRQRGAVNESLFSSYLSTDDHARLSIELDGASEFLVFDEKQAGVQVNRQRIPIDSLVPLNVWTHITVRYDAMITVPALRLEMYVNGTQITLDNPQGSPALSPTAFGILGRVLYIGYRTDFTSAAFVGQLAGVHFYPALVSPTEFGLLSGSQFVPALPAPSSAPEAFRLLFADPDPLNFDSDGMPRSFNLTGTLSRETNTGL